MPAMLIKIVVDIVLEVVYKTDFEFGQPYTETAIYISCPICERRFFQQPDPPNLTEDGANAYVMRLKDYFKIENLVAVREAAERQIPGWHKEDRRTCHGTICCITYKILALFYLLGLCVSR